MDVAVGVNPIETQIRPENHLCVANALTFELRVICDQAFSLSKKLVVYGLINRLNGLMSSRGLVVEVLIQKFGRKVLG